MDAWPDAFMARLLLSVAPLVKIALSLWGVTTAAT